MIMITDNDRPRALEMWRAATRADGVSEYKLPNTINEGHARYWLAAEAHVLAAHECQPAWRPTTREEIQPGWEIRARRRNGFEATWGVAHHQDSDGDWRTEAGAVVTYAVRGWTYETTASLPEPEPWDEALVGVVSDALAEGPAHHRVDDARRVLDALAARGYLDRAAITGGEQS